MALSGFKINVDMHFFDVKIDYFGDNHIHTFKCGEQNNTDMVILHGYGGSGTTFYRMVKPLSEFFRVFCIDFLGMGLSSRPNFTLDSTEKVIEFFVESLEKWRQAMNLKSFHLAGHSLGGYLAVNYALKYPQYVTKLTLISPAGITKQMDDISIEEMTKKMSFFRKCIFKIFLGFWNKKMTPSSGLKSLGFVGRKLLGRYVEKRFARPKEETKLLYSYFLSILSMPDSSDKSLHYFFKPPRARPCWPLEDLIETMQTPIDFYFGDKDWMDWAGASRLTEKSDGKFRLLWIAQAGHHINMDNPEQLCDYILSHAKAGLITKDEIPLIKPNENLGIINEKIVQKELEDEEIFADEEINYGINGVGIIQA